MSRRYRYGTSPRHRTDDFFSTISLSVGGDRFGALHLDLLYLVSPILFLFGADDVDEAAFCQKRVIWALS